jgi:ribosomal-protein-alanine N-acetyltransferase
MLKKEFDIRPASSKDSRFLQDMLYECIFIAEGEERPDKDIVKKPELAKYVEGWKKKGDTGLIVYEIKSLKPAGAVWLRIFSEENKGYGFINEKIPELSIAVKPGHRGKGLGTLLLNHLFETIKGKYSSVSLSVSQNNPALKLYESAGFYEFIKAGETIIMKKDL